MLLMLALSLSSGAAGAQTVPPAPDVVVLKNGGRLRGTIAELVKGSPVTIVLITGETRKVEAEAIAYAGPVAGEPAVHEAEQWPPPINAAPPPEPAPSAAVAPPTPAPASAPPSGQAIELAPVRFVSNRRGTELFVGRVGSRAQKICTAPCTHDFQPDIYRIAVRFPDQDRARALREVTLDRPTTVSIDYRSREGLRDVGVLVAGVSLALSGLSFFYIAAVEDPQRPVANTGLFSGLGGIITGLILFSVDDHVALTVK
jgi:hypothetical protein